jgi:hypothetical protein
MMTEPVVLRSYTSGDRTAEITLEEKPGWTRYVVQFSDLPWVQESFERLETAEQCVEKRFNPKPQQRRRKRA